MGCTEPCKYCRDSDVFQKLPKHIFYGEKEVSRRKRGIALVEAIPLSFQFFRLDFPEDYQI